MVWGLSIKTPYLINIGAEPLDGDFQKVDVIDRTPDGGALPGGGWGAGARLMQNTYPQKCGGATQDTRSLISIGLGV